MAFMKMPCAVGTGGGNTLYYINEKPSSRVINCGFTPKHIIMGCSRYDGVAGFWVSWDADNPTTENYAYNNSYGPRALVCFEDFTASGFSITSGIYDGLDNNCTFLMVSDS